MRTNALTVITALTVGWAAASPAAAQDRVYETEYVYETQPRHEDYVRFRFGVAGVGGGQWASGPDLGMGGAQLRFGVQIGDLLAIYYMPTGLVASIMDRPGSSNSVAGLMWNTAMVEFTLANIVQVAGGPSMDFTWGCDRRFQNEVSCDSSDPRFGAHGRVAIVIGGHGPGQRGGLTISADVHPTWYRSDDAAIAVLGGLGFDLY